MCVCFLHMGFDGAHVNKLASVGVEVHTGMCTLDRAKVKKYSNLFIQMATDKSHPKKVIWLLFRSIGYGVKCRRRFASKKDKSNNTQTVNS